MTEVCRTDNFVAKCYEDPNNETYETNKYINGEFTKCNVPLYNIIKIHKTESDEVIWSYKECRRGPSHQLRAFVKIDGTQWFIGAFNFKCRCFLNCETGKYVEAGEHDSWYNIKSMSPNGKFAIIYTYTYGGNTEYIRMYDFSQLETVGPVMKHIKNLPDIFDPSYPERFTFDFVSDTEIRAKYKWNEEDKEWRDMGIYKFTE